MVKLMELISATRATTQNLNGSREEQSDIDPEITAEAPDTIAGFALGPIYLMHGPTRFTTKGVTDKIVWER